MVISYWLVLKTWQWNAFLKWILSSEYIAWKITIWCRNFSLRPSSCMNGSVRPVHPAGRPSVTPFSLCSHHHINMKFQELLPMTEVRSMQKLKFTYGDEVRHKAWCCLGEVPYYFSSLSVKFQGHTGQKKSSILTWIGRFRTVTPLFIHR